MRCRFWLFRGGGADVLDAGKWWQYFCTPAGMFLLAATVCAVGPAWAIWKLARRNGEPSRLVEILLTGGRFAYDVPAGVLWLVGIVTYTRTCSAGVGAGEWSWPALRWVTAGALIALMVLSAMRSWPGGVVDWKWKTREAKGLWAYPATNDEWRDDGTGGR